MGMTMNVFVALLAMTLIGGSPRQVMAVDQEPGILDVDFSATSLNPGTDTMWSVTASFSNFNPIVGYDLHFYFKGFDNTDITVLQVNDLSGTISLTPVSNAFFDNIAQGGTLNELLPGMVQGPIFLPVTCSFMGLPGDSLPPCDSAPKVPRFEIIVSTPEPATSSDIIVGGPPPEFVETPVFAISVIILPPVDFSVPTPAPAPAPAPGPPPPLSPSSSPPPQITSDPHFRGFRGQEFDFEGLPDKIYNLLTERDDYGFPTMVLNTKLSKAFTTGISTDPDTMIVQNYQSRGTWMSQVGFTLGDSTFLATSEPQAELQRSSRVKFGSFFINSQPIEALGEYSMNDLTLVTISNSKTYSRAQIIGTDVTLTIDVVGPPASWGVPDQDAEAFTHINIKFPRILLQTMEGVIGETARPTEKSRRIESTHTVDSESSSPARDAESSDYHSHHPSPKGRNEEAILQHSVDYYQVDAIFDYLLPSDS